MQFDGLYLTLMDDDDDDDDEGRINFSMALSLKTTRTHNNKLKQWSHVIDGSAVQCVTHFDTKTIQGRCVRSDWLAVCKIWSSATCADLKKTVAVLLESLLDRVHVLEQKIDRLSPSNQSARSSYGIVRPADSLVLPSVTTGGTGKSVNAQGSCHRQTAFCVLFSFFCLQHH